MALARYEGVVQDESGNVVPGATIEVRREDNLTALALLYSDRSGFVSQANGASFLSAADGTFAFHTLGGAHRIEANAVIGGQAFQQIKRYVPIGTAGETDTELGLSGGMLLTFDDGTTDADPGAGQLRFNHATPASVTFLYVDLADIYASDITAWLESLDDSGSPTDKGRLRIQVAGNPAAWFVFKITGAVVSATGYRKIPVTLVASSGSTLTDGDTLSVFDIPTGPGVAADISYAGHSAFGAADTVEEGLDAAGDKLQHITVTQAVDLDAIETRVNALDAAIVLKGTWDASAGTFPGGGTAQAGESWIVSVGGTVGGTVFAVNDRLIAITDNASTTTFAANWFKADYTDLVQSVDGATGAVTLGAIIAAATGKTTPVDADTLALSDSAASNATKKVTWANIKATLKTYTDTLYQSVSTMLTGLAALSDPNADRIFFWDDSAGAPAWLTLGTNLSVTGTTLNASGGGGGGSRTALTADTDFYVRTDGDDGNDGSTNDAGGAFLTLQAACNYIKDYIDLNGFDAFIRPQKIGGVPTTYDGVALFSEFTGGGSVYIIGDQTTPSDIIIDGGAANCFQLYYGARLFIYGVKLTAATGRGLYTAFGGIIVFDDIDFGDCGTYHIRASGGTIYCSGSYEITGDAAYHWGIHAGGNLYLNGVAITLTGTPAFSSAFCFMESGANIELNGTTFTGSATGKRFLIYGGDMKVTGGVVADTFLPGSIAGTIAAGAHSPGGVFMIRQISGEVKDQLIADDAVFTLKLDDISAGIVLMTIHTASGAKTAVPVGQFRVRAGGAGAFIENISLDLTKVTLNTAVIPTGTTGTDTFFTISAHVNGNVYFENRTGAGRYITLLIM